MEMMGTTICAVRRGGKIAIAGDGQITMGQSVILKGSAKKVKRIYDDKVVIGFAGSVSDAISLSEKFEKMLQKYSGNLMRSAVELAELWRDDKARKLEAMMLVADKDNLLIVSGSGEVIDPDGDACAIGSGGNYALAAARAMVKETNLSAKEIAYKALIIASELCVFTNSNIIVEEV